MIKPIDIKTPIWSSRSVGLQINNLTPEDLVDVTISYRTKDGNLLYPGTFRISVLEIQRYKPATIRGANIGLYEVPISVLLEHRLVDTVHKAVEEQPKVPIGGLFGEAQTTSTGSIPPVDQSIISPEMSQQDIEEGYRSIRIVLKGNPIAKQSTRFYVRRDKKSGNVMTYQNKKGQLDVFVDTYTDKKYTQAFELMQNQIRLIISTKYPGWEPFSEIVHTTRFECIFKHPKNFPKYKIKAIEEKTAIFYKTTQPDLSDNLKKLPLDAMESLVFVNDGLIVSESGVIKRYGIRPGIIIEMKGK